MSAIGNRITTCRPGFKRDRTDGLGLILRYGSRTERITKIPSGPFSCVYLFRSESGEALYVGRTTNLEVRLIQHNARPWWPEVAEIECVPLDRERDLYLTEAELVGALNPKYCRQGADHLHLVIARRRRTEHLLPSCPQWREWGGAHTLTLTPALRCTPCGAVVLASGMPSEMYAEAEHAIYAANPGISVAELRTQARAAVMAGAA